MPGHNDNEDPKADYLCPFSIYGLVVAAPPPALADLAVLDLAKSITAARNRILVVHEHVSGAGTGGTKFRLHAKLAGSLDTVFVKVAETTSFGAPKALVQFNNLPAGDYVIETVLENSADIVRVHAAHNDLTGVL